VTTEDEPPLDEDELTNGEVTAAVAELTAAYSRSQQNYDESVRTIAAGAVAVTASLVTALNVVGWSGGFAIGLSLLALGANLGSYWTAQFAIEQRIRRAWKRDRAGAERNGRWTGLTKVLNAAAGLLLVAAGISLVVYLDSHT
jgi:hypothetical protein